MADRYVCSQCRRECSMMGHWSEKQQTWTCFMKWSPKAGRWIEAPSDSAPTGADDATSTDVVWPERTGE